MKRIIVRSLYDAFEYVMEHFHTFGDEELAVKKDTYAVISLQDSYTGGLGFEFSKNNFCKGVLTLLVEDITTETKNKILFSEDHAAKIIDFVKQYLSVETLLVHCYGGQSRSVAVGAFAYKMLGGDNSFVFENNTPNMHIYNTLESIWKNESADIKKDLVIEGLELDLMPRNVPSFTKICEYDKMFNGK